jgi:hypothetical protein
MGVGGIVSREVWYCSCSKSAISVVAMMSRGANGLLVVEPNIGTFVESGMAVSSERKGVG